MYRLGWFKGTILPAESYSMNPFSLSKERLLLFLGGWPKKPWLVFVCSARKKVLRIAGGIEQR